jgi:hypothetical protein
MSDLSTFINQISSQSRQPQFERNQLDAAARDIAARNADAGRSRANDQASFRRLIQTANEKAANEKAADEKAASEMANNSRAATKAADRDKTVRADKNGGAENNKNPGEVRISQALINKLAGQLNGNDGDKSTESLKDLLANLEDDTNGKAQGLLKQLLSLARKGDNDTQNSIIQLLESLAPGNSGGKKQALGEKLAAIADKINTALKEGEIKEGKNSDDDGNGKELSVEKLKTLLSQENELSAEGIPGLLTANLSPQQLSALSETLQGKSASEGKLQGLLQSLVHLKGGQAKGSNNNVPLQDAINNALKQNNSGNATNSQHNGQSQAASSQQDQQSGKTFEARLNALINNGNSEAGKGKTLDLSQLPPGPKQLAQSRLDFLQYSQGGQAAGQTNAGANTATAAQNWMNAAKGANGKNATNSNNAGTKSAAGMLGKNGTLLQVGQMRGLSPLSGLMQGNNAGLNTQFDQLSDWMMQFGGQPSSANTSGNSGTMALFATAQSTGANHAIQQHASTRMVAATLQKHAGRSGQGSRNLTLQMEPPDLGRVKIRMDMSSDNQLRTHLTVEKPETLSMLQRDGHTLQRALQQAGVDTSSEEALSFELAQDDSAFGQENEERGGNSGDGRTGRDGADSGDGDDEEIIETDMTWTIDPETGIEHYDILA